MSLLATYVHHLDPVLFEVSGTPIAVRWYGLSYLLSFFLGYLLLRFFSRRQLYCVPPDDLSDFMAVQVGVLGVIGGARLGEFFFYWLPRVGASGFLADPLWVLRLWEGGMSAHGGMVGVFFVTLAYAYRHKLSFARVADGVAIVAPVGLFCGRVANFINGELYGRVCNADSWLAVKFPQSFGELPPETRKAAASALECVMQAPFQSFFQRDAHGVVSEREGDMLSRMCRENELFRNVLGEYLQPRYPSQLFEACSEGLLLLLVVLMSARLAWKGAPAGVFSGLFCVGYAVARIVCECFKQPDDAVWMGVTKGQWLSVGVFMMGVGFLIYSFSRKRKMNSPA